MSSLVFMLMLIADLLIAVVLVLLFTFERMQGVRREGGREGRGRQALLGACFAQKFCVPMPCSASFCISFYDHSTTHTQEPYALVESLGLVVSV